MRFKKQGRLGIRHGAKMINKKILNGIELVGIYYRISIEI